MGIYLSGSIVLGIDMKLNGSQVSKRLASLAKMSIITTPGMLMGWMEGGNTRDLGDEVDDVLVVDEEVAQSVAEAEDERARHHLKRHAQRYAHIACAMHASTSNYVGCRVHPLELPYLDARKGLHGRRVGQS